MKILYFLLSAGVMGGVGILLLVPPLRAKQFDDLFTRMMLAFVAKLLLGVGLLALCWKVFGWSATWAAFGMVTAYLVALLVMSIVVMQTVRKGQA